MTQTARAVLRRRALRRPLLARGPARAGRRDAVPAIASLVGATADVRPGRPLRTARRVPSDREGRKDGSIREELLNATLLGAVWPELRLPVRCRTTWEAAFPELIT